MHHHLHHHIELSSCEEEGSGILRIASSLLTAPSPYACPDEIEIHLDKIWRPARPKEASLTKPPGSGFDVQVDAVSAKYISVHTVGRITTRYRYVQYAFRTRAIKV